MPERFIEFYPYWYYHIYNRSLTKESIFLNDSDYKKFLDKKDILLEENLKDFKIQIPAYSIMPNHFHFIITYTNEEEENIITKFMHRLQTSYSMYFNKKYWRKWQLFEWRFKANPITNDKYLEWCFTYVTFNPVKHWIINDIEKYPYTSYHELKEDEKNYYKWINKNIGYSEELEF